MIDEKKLIEEMQARRDFWINKSAKCIENGNTFKAYMCNIIAAELNTILHMTDEQPKAGEWIPCSERLPNSAFNVEVTTKDNKRTIGYYAGYAGNWYSPITDDLIFVKAWKEPSDPWEGECK